LTTVAAVVLFAGCGGGSANKSAGSVSAGAVSRDVSAKEGGFRTLIPLGYTKSASETQYNAIGPQEGGIYDTVLVIHEPVRLGDINTLARRTLRVTRHQKRIHHVSQIHRLSVGGEPALAVDYYVSPGGGQGEAHLRQVFVSHGKWVYIIRASAVITQDAVSLRALDEVISNWQWP